MDDVTPKAELEVRLDTEALPTPVKDALVPGTGAPPVPEQRASHVNAAKLASEKVVVGAPMSYAGSAARIWRLVGLSENAGVRVAIALGAICLILVAWCFVTVWYFAFSIFLVPYRFIRRGQRKRKREALQHREMMAAIQSRKD